MMHGEGIAEFQGLLWLVAVIAAVAALFAAGLRLPPIAPGWGRWAGRLAIAVAGVAVVLAANVALFRNDTHLDLTRENVFTPSAEAMQVIRSLERDVELIYFYQGQNPAGRTAKTMVELMGRLNPRLKVRTIDPDQNPALASSYGVRLYNAALLIADGRRLEVVTTEDREIALGILRLLRVQTKAICFLSDNGEYDIDNFEFHTHFEGSHSHSHDVQGAAVVQMDQHGIGRLRRALERLGLTPRKLSLGAAKDVAADCAAVVQANPRTQMPPAAIEALRRYLANGGSYLLLVEPDFAIDEGLAGLLAAIGVVVGPGTLIDPDGHYFTDNQMLAVKLYANHPATQRLALTIFPGARPVKAVAAPGIASVPLFTTGAGAYAVDDRLQAQVQAPQAPRAQWPIAVAAEGRIGGQGKPFRAVVFGDADFASNSFFPYLSNADLVLGSLAWAVREERAPTMKPPVEVLPLVTLTANQTQWIFMITVLLMPGLLVLVGGLVWWLRRR